MEKKLFDEFDEVSSKAWKQKIQYDLKGEDYNESLVWELPEGIKIRPFYHSDDIREVEKNKNSTVKDWAICQEIYVVNTQKANLKALDALNRGAESILFSIPSEDIEIKDLLLNINIELIPVLFNLQFISVEFVEQLQGYLGAKKSKIRLNVDIIGHLAKSGNWFFNLKKDHEILDQIHTKIQNTEITSFLGVDVTLYQNAGANTVQQLAYALAHANEYLNHFTSKEFEGLTFKVAVGSNYFLEIAKLRALRLLWKTLASAYNISQDCHITASPTNRNKTLYDYNINMLRTTSECMSAIIGGANIICNSAYDNIYHKTNEFGERIARNQLLIMKHEGHLDKVNNPADGSYYIKTLTQQLAEKALILFKNIEAGGGFLKQLKDHTIQRKIKESAQKEQKNFNTAEDILVGTNAYQNANDHMKDNLELYPFVKTIKRKTLIEPIIERRLAEDLEQKRLKDE